MFKNLNTPLGSNIKDHSPTSQTFGDDRPLTKTAPWRPGGPRCSEGLRWGANWGISSRGEPPALAELKGELHKKNDYTLWKKIWFLGKDQIELEHMGLEADVSSWRIGLLSTFGVRLLERTVNSGTDEPGWSMFKLHFKFYTCLLGKDGHPRKLWGVWRWVASSKVGSDWMCSLSGWSNPTTNKSKPHKTVSRHYLPPVKKIHALTGWSWYHRPTCSNRYVHHCTCTLYMIIYDNILCICLHCIIVSICCYVDWCIDTYQPTWAMQFWRWLGEEGRRGYSLNILYRKSNNIITSFKS